VQIMQNRCNPGQSPPFNLRCLLASLVIVSLAAAAIAADTGSPATGDTTSSTPGPTAETDLLAPYDMSWWSVDGGGGTSSGGLFAVTGAIGQPDAGAADGCCTMLDGGVWSGALPGGAPVFCDGFESGDSEAWSGATP
jgi:hypothetical protein